MNEEELKKNPDKTVLSLSETTTTVILGGVNSVIFAKVVIQINGECPKEILEAIVNAIENKSAKHE